MSKTLTVPTGSTYKASDADVGTITGTLPNLKASSVDISTIKNVLGSSSYDAETLCTHPNINKWALFSPSGFKNVNPFTGSYPISLPIGGVNSPYYIGEFAGYNHQAKPPTYFSYINSTNPTIEEYDSHHISCRLERGEMLPIPSGASQDDITVYILDDGGTSVYDEKIAVGELGSPTVGSEIHVSGTGTKTYKIKACYKNGTHYNNIIEDGIKDININITPLKISGTLTNEDLVGSKVYFDVSITRTTNTPKDLYYRAIVFGGLQLSGHYTFGKVSLAANETKRYTNKYISLIGMGIYTAQTVAIHLEASVFSDFRESKKIAEGEIKI